MWTMKYKTGYINGYCDKQECEFVIPTDEGGVFVSKEYKTLMACKIALTKHINSEA